jgi:hypothetical protein
MIRLLRDGPAHPKDLTGLFVVLGAFAIACFGVVPLLGLPGAAILGLTVLILNPFISATLWSHMTADVYWLLSIMLSVLWPLGILPGYWIAFKRTYRRALKFKMTLLVAIVAVWNLLVSAILLFTQ